MRNCSLADAQKNLWIAIALKRIGYLINQYPMASQTFIRREIAAIEAMGTPIKRYAVRGWDTPLIDSDDQSEAAKTRHIVDVGIPRLLWALLATVVSRPRKFARALAESWRLGRQSDRGVVIHFAYLAEACVLRAVDQKRFDRPSSRALRFQFGGCRPPLPSSGRPSLQLYRARS